MFSFNVWVGYEAVIQLLFNVKNKHYTRRFKQIENKSVYGQWLMVLIRFLQTCIVFTLKKNKIQFDFMKGITQFLTS